MRTFLSASPERPAVAIASIAAYTALVTLVITLFTTSGHVAAVAGTLTVGLLVGSYLLGRWARRHPIHSTDSRRSPTTSTSAEAKAAQVKISDAPDSERQTSTVDESRMARI
jgi:hypothetical protein